jgi:hypothetical protein
LSVPYHTIPYQATRRRMKPLIVISFLLASASAFAPLVREHGSVRQAPETALGPLTKGKIIDPLSVNEEARKLRRDFFTHESWLKHRSKDRFLATITKLLFESRVVRALIEELIFGRCQELWSFYRSRRCPLHSPNHRPFDASPTTHPFFRTHSVRNRRDI